MGAIRSREKIYEWALAGRNAEYGNRLLYCENLFNIQARSRRRHPKQMLRRDQSSLRFIVRLFGQCDSSPPVVTSGRPRKPWKHFLEFIYTRCGLQVGLDWMFTYSKPCTWLWKKADHWDEKMKPIISIGRLWNNWIDNRFSGGARLAGRVERSPASGERQKALIYCDSWVNKSTCRINLSRHGSSYIIHWHFPENSSKYGREKKKTFKFHAPTITSNITSPL